MGRKGRASGSGAETYRTPHTNHVSTCARVCVLWPQISMGADSWSTRTSWCSQETPTTTTYETRSVGSKYLIFFSKRCDYCCVPAPRTLVELSPSWLPPRGVVVRGQTDAPRVTLLKSVENPMPPPTTCRVWSGTPFQRVSKLPISPQSRDHGAAVYSRLRLGKAREGVGIMFCLERAALPNWQLPIYFHSV